MKRIIKSMEPRYLDAALDFVERVFAAAEGPEEGKTVRNLVAEIRSKKYYTPELDLIMTDEADEIIGYVMFSGFPIEGRYEDELLLLSPAAVKTGLQRQHISRDLIEYGFEKASELGYKAVLVIVVEYENKLGALAVHKSRHHTGYRVIRAVVYSAFVVIRHNLPVYSEP